MCLLPVAIIEVTSVHKPGDLALRARGQTNST
jgi:hypothetical protein